MRDAVIILLLLQAPVLVARPPKPTASGPDQRAQQSNSQKTNAVPSPPVKKTEDPVGETGNSNGIADENKHVHAIVDSLPKKDIWDIAYDLATWLLVVIGAGTLGAIWYQAVQTRRAADAARDTVTEIQNQVTIMERQTTATEKSANVAKQNIELIIRKERAVIDVKAPLPLDLGNPIPASPNLYSIRYKVFFHCPIGAIITGTSAWGVVLAAPWVKDREVSLSINEIPEGFVRPGIGDIDCETWVDLPQPRREQIEKRESAVHFYGFIKYRDIHMEDSAPDLTMPFHYVWMPGGLLWKVFFGTQWLPFERWKQLQDKTEKRKGDQYPAG